ncbi:MAG TPA: hypothetical protein VMW81_08995 [Nitrospinota bacterium]|nr:hypothetical protein [Nitrospinota bacterium]
MISLKDGDQSRSMLRESFLDREIVLEPIELGDDLLVLLYGGSRSHIGSCILSIPRPTLRGGNKISCTSSVMNIVGHKDEEVGREAAEAITRVLNKKVMLVCGIHYEGLLENDLKQIKEICRRLVKRYLKSKE